MEYLLKLSLNLLFLCHYTIANFLYRNFEPKYSFKPPYLARRVGSLQSWEYGGNVVPISQYIRITAALKNQKGALWTKQPIDFDWWEVDIAFKVTGSEQVGGDGLAFWYTQTKGGYDGKVFGSADKWTGLGIFFDSFDNNNQHNNPYIMAVLNDGTKHFHHQKDGRSEELGGCLKNFRNTPFLLRARIVYYQNILTVLFHNGMASTDQGYEVCLRSDKIFLPRNGYFGLSAATGDSADNHDVVHFITNSLNLQDKAAQSSQVKEEEQDYQEIFRQILQEQSKIFVLTKDLIRKIDNVLDKEENILRFMTEGRRGN